jgi:predicted Zn-dependent protease with MMP-like domain
MEAGKFEALVAKAIEALPEEFKEKLENIDILIEDWPSQRQLRKVRLRQPVQLLGLYEGVPRTGRGQGYNMVLPDKITIFQKPIESICSSDKEIEAEVGDVVRHEIAHYFGIGDGTLRKIESQKRKKKKT